MAGWIKSPRTLIELFNDSLPDDPRVERRQMFGYPCAFAQGNLMAGLFQDQMFARLPPDESARLVAAHGPLPFEPMPGRPMKAYTRLPDDLLAEDEDLARALVLALEQTLGLPPKEKAAPRQKAIKGKKPSP